jgi:opacity protein-like surface antigen
MKICQETYNMKRYFNIALAGTVLVTGLALAPQFAQAQDRKDAPATYHDKKNNEDHQWNGQEDKAYAIYQKDKHKKDVEFGKLKESDQQAYWNWRHEHSDALLKIDIK